MKVFQLIPFILVLALLGLVVDVADHLGGVVAYTYRYLAFCGIAALLFASVWFLTIKRHTILFTLVVFSFFAAKFVLPPPSERLLRSAMLAAEPGTEASKITSIVEEAYEGSGFVLPGISQDQFGGSDRIHVSLLTQKAGHCTALIFLIEDGKVVRSIFSPD